MTIFRTFNFYYLLKPNTHTYIQQRRDGNTDAVVLTTPFNTGIKKKRVGPQYYNPNLNFILYNTTRRQINFN